MKYFVHFDEHYQYGLCPCRLYSLVNRRGVVRLPDPHTLHVMFWNVPHVIQEIVR